MCTLQVKALARLSLKDPEYIAVHEKAKHATPKKLVRPFAQYGVCERVWMFVIVTVPISYLSVSVTGPMCAPSPPHRVSGAKLRRVQAGGQGQSVVLLHQDALEGEGQSRRQGRRGYRGEHVRVHVALT